MEPVGLWEWFGLIFLFFIPIVNIIAVITIACGVGKPSLVNYCRAGLIWFAIGLGLALLYAFLSGSI